MRGGLLLWLVASGCSFDGASGDGSADGESSDTVDGTDGDPTDSNVVPDAAVVDAPDASFDLSLCDAHPGYEMVVGAPSRYRWGTGNRNAWDALRDCANDIPGLTHALVLETIAEHDAIEMEMRRRPGDRFWVGGLQELDQGRPDQGWIWVTGAPWRSDWHPSEPTDWNPDDQMPDGSEHGVEQFVRIDESASGFVDAWGGDDGFTLCECDGQAMTAAALELLDELAP